LKEFKGTGSVAKQKSSGRPGTSEENMERITESCIRSLKISIDRRSLELAIPKTATLRVIQKRLLFYAFKIQMKHDDRPRCYDFASLMLNKIDDD
jgi:hypothetical protein